MMNEGDYFNAGKDRLVIDFKGWKICPLICYDLRFPVFSRNNENFDLELHKFVNNKFFYDVIYNPSETNFLKNAKLNDNKTENGRMMFIYQAHQSFALWHKVLPKIDEETIEILK